MNVTFPGESLLTELVGLGKEFITDKDKLFELQYKAQELQHNMRLAALQQTTVPWVDSLVKLMIFIRPIGSALMTAFGAYCHYRGIDLSEVVHLTFDAAFPAWGASRHVNKTNELKEKERTKQITQPTPAPLWDEEGL